VRKGKGELFDHMRTNGGAAFIFSDYDYLKDMSAGIKEIITYGTTNGSIRGHAVGDDMLLQVQFTHGLSSLVRTQLVGAYNLPNVLAAATVGKHFGIEENKITTALEQYTPSNSRSQLMEKGTNKIILDAYNANPSSMKLAIENFARMEASKKILVIGAMAELGTDSVQEHQAIIDQIDQYKWNDVILVGGDFMQLDHAYNKSATAIDAGQLLNQLKPQDTHFLLKGSRSTGMEKVLPFL
jgi:UDP-N-acetylmuramoyl-tripeptide--D-alanyl-D-alanine ligase